MGRGGKGRPDLIETKQTKYMSEQEIRMQCLVFAMELRGGDIDCSNIAHIAEYFTQFVLSGIDNIAK